MEPRTEMKCRICGEFSSAVVCYRCTQDPLTTKVRELQEELKYKNLLITELERTLESLKEK